MAWIDRNLPETRLEVELRQVSCCCEQLEGVLDMWQGEQQRNSDGVNWLVVDTKPIRAVLLFDDQWPTHRRACVARNRSFENSLGNSFGNLCLETVECRRSHGEFFSVWEPNVAGDQMGGERVK